MKSTLSGVGRRAKEVREQLRLSVAEFALRVQATPKMIEIIEADGILHDGNALRILERIASAGGQPLEALLLQHTSLFELTANEKKMKAWAVILQNGFTKSLAVVDHVFRQIEQGCELALAEQGLTDREFRDKGGILSTFDEDTIHEMVVRAKRELQ
jgi:transcriptional regulator with XRE-family HTH domain